MQHSSGRCNNSLILSQVSGKIVTYALAFGEGARATVKGLRFFGTTLAMWNMHSSTVEGCDFDHPSFSRRSLAAFDANATKSPYYLNEPPYNLPFAELDATAAKLKGAAPTILSGKKLDKYSPDPQPTCTAVTDSYGDCTKHVIRRNTFKYTDGIALFLYRTADDLIEDNLFQHIDYSAVGIGFGMALRTAFGLPTAQYCKSQGFMLSRMPLRSGGILSNGLQTQSG